MVQVSGWARCPGDSQRPRHVLARCVCRGHRMHGCVGYLAGNCFDAPPPARQPACACGRLCERCRNSGGLLHETCADGRRRPCGLIASLRDSFMSLPCTQHLFCCWPSPVVGARHMLSTANTRAWPQSRRGSCFFFWGGVRPALVLDIVASES